MKDTLIINFFGGPGCGKSTGATWLFSQLKLRGIDCEYVSEYAKDKVWENNKDVFDCQFYLTGKQVYKIKRCVGKVDVVITDSPIAIGAQYCDEKFLKLAILDEFNKYGERNFNVLLRRVKEYNPNGRNQTEDEAKEIDTSVKNWLDENNIDYVSYNGDEDGYKSVLGNVLEIIENNEKTIKIK